MGFEEELQKDLDEMEKALEEPDAGLDDLRTDPPPTDAPKTSPPPTNAPETDAPKTDAPPTDAPKTEAPKTDAPHTEPPEEDPRDAELRRLREENEKLLKEKEEPKPTKAPPTNAPSTDPPIGEEDFLGDIDLDELTRDPKLFNQILNKAYLKGRESTRGEIKKAVENIIRSIPDITKNTVAVQTKLAEARDNFYKENEDLRPWAKAVATVMEEMIAKNPDKRYDELLPDVATEVRKRIGLQKKVTDKKKDGDDKPPPLHKKKSGKRQTPEPDLTTLDKEMDEMDKALGLD